jgi:hypothetical protein
MLKSKLHRATVTHADLNIDDREVASTGVKRWTASIVGDRLTFAADGVPGVSWAVVLNAAKGPWARPQGA